MSGALNSYVISLITAQERRKHINKEFSRQGLAYSFLDALSPTDNLQPYIEQFIPNLSQAKLSPGEKCCFLSHLLLWNKCFQENLDYIVIFEDDVLLSNQAHLFLKNDDWLTQRFDFSKPFILRLETYLMPVQQEKTDLTEYHQYHFQQSTSVHYGCAGYIISKQAIKNLLDEFKSLCCEKIKPIDNLIFEYIHYDKKIVQIYQLEPAICVQENILHKEKSHLLSQLGEERKIFRRKTSKEEKKTIRGYLTRILYRAKRRVEKLRDKIHTKKSIVMFR